jgi:hypothetical protein
MVYFLSNEFMAPANQVVQEEASLDDEQVEGLMAQLVLAKQAIFDKPGQKSTHEAAVLEGVCQWQAIDQDVCRRWGGGQCNVVHHLQETWHGPWRSDAYKHNTERFRRKSFRHQGYPSSGSWHSCLQGSTGTNFSSLQLGGKGQFLKASCH